MEDVADFVVLGFHGHRGYGTGRARAETVSHSHSVVLFAAGDCVDGDCGVEISLIDESLAELPCRSLCQLWVVQYGSLAYASQPSVPPMRSIVAGHIVDAELYLCTTKDLVVGLLAQVVQQLARADVAVSFLVIGAIAGFDNDYFGLIQQFVAFRNVSCTTALIKSRCQSAGHQGNGRQGCQLVP